MTKANNQKHSPSKKTRQSASKDKPKKHRKVLRNSLEGITKNAIKRLAYCAGAGTVTSTVMAKVRELIKDEVTEVLRRAVILTEVKRRKTVSANHIVSALPMKMFSENVLKNVFKLKKKAQVQHQADNAESVTKKRKAGQVLKSQIRHFQKQYGQLMVRKDPFRRLVKEVGQDMKNDLNFNSLGLVILQYYVESRIVKVLRSAWEVAQHNQRLSVFPQDIDIVLDIESSTGVNVTNVPNVGSAQFDFGSYIHTVLKQLHPETNISKDAKSQVNQFVNVVGKMLVEQSKYFMSKDFNQVAKTSKRSKSEKDEKSSKTKDKDANAGKKKTKSSIQTMNSRFVQSAVSLLLPRELAKHAVNAGAKAVTKYSSATSDKSSHSGKSAVKKMSLSVKAGLQFSVARVRNMIRASGVKKVGGGCPIYLAGVLEYLTAEVLELSGKCARDRKRTTILARDLYLSMTNDESLLQLMKVCGFRIIGAGVVPHIDELLLPKRKDSKKAKTHVESGAESGAEEKSKSKSKSKTKAKPKAKKSPSKKTKSKSSKGKAKSKSQSKTKTVTKKEKSKSKSKSKKSKSKSDKSKSKSKPKAKATKAKK